jgi:hypothetical protein
VISTYELSIDEVVSSGPDRLIVFEGAEEKMVQLSVGLLERLGIGSAPWDRNDDSDYIMPVSTANQLPSGVQVAADFTKARPATAEERWSDDDWGQPERLEQPLQAQQSAERYQAAALDNPSTWSEPGSQGSRAAYDADFQDVTDDVWSEEDEGAPYEAKPLNIPQKKKVTEYEEELDY